MSSWLISIIGVVFCCLLLDIIYPNGKTNVFCKSIFGIFAVIVIITPLINMMKSKNKNNLDFVDTELVTDIFDAQSVYYTNLLEKHFAINKINGLSVEITGNIENNVYEIENVYIDISQLVLTENLTNINKYEVITKMTKELLKIDSERIIFYG